MLVNSIKFDQSGAAGGSRGDTHRGVNTFEKLAFPKIKRHIGMKPICDSHEQIKVLFLENIYDRILSVKRSYSFRQMIVYIQIFMIVYFRRSYTFSRKIVYFPPNDRILSNFYDRIL